MPPRRTPATRAFARTVGEETVDEPMRVDLQDAMELMRQQAAEQQAAFREMLAEEINRIRTENAPVPPQAPVHAPPPPPPPYYMVQDQTIRGVQFGQFTNQRTPHFAGGNESLSAHSWLCRVEKDLKVIGANREYWVSFSTHLLTDAAEDWWTAKSTSLDEPIAWETFTRLFNDRYYPDWLRSEKEVEFIQLTQGSSSVAKYEEKFVELMRFAPRLVATEEDQMKKFTRGLRPEQMYAVDALTCHTLREVLGKAITYEKKEASERAASQRGQPSRNPNANKRRYENQRPQEHDPRQGQRPRNGDVVCYRCGAPGHYSRECPQREAYNPQQIGVAPPQLAIAPPPHQQAPPRQQVQDQRVPAQRAPAQRGPVQQQARRPQAQGRVFALNQVQAEQQPDLVQEGELDPAAELDVEEHV